MKRSFALVLLAWACTMLAACAPSVTLTTDSFSTPLVSVQDGTTAQTTALEIRSLFETVIINTLAADSPVLVDARIQHAFPITFEATGGTDRGVRLISDDASTNFSYVGDMPQWSIGVHPTPSLALTTRTGAGDQQLNLGQFSLVSVSASTVGGTIRALLPAMSYEYPVDLHSERGSINAATMTGAVVMLDLTTEQGTAAFSMTADSSVAGTIGSESGAITLNLASSTSGTLSIETQSGAVVIQSPSATPALRIEIVSASAILLPEYMLAVPGAAQGTSGIWESADYPQAARRVTLRVTAGTGTVTVE